MTEFMDIRDIMDDEGNEWINVSDIVKTTMKSMHDVMLEQQSQIALLREELAVIKKDGHDAHQQLRKETQTNLSHTRTEIEDSISRLNSTKVTSSAFEAALQPKADLRDLIRIQNEYKEFKKDMEQQADQAQAQIRALQKKLHLQEDVTTESHKLTQDDHKKLQQEILNRDEQLQTRFDSMIKLIQTKANDDDVFKKKAVPVLKDELYSAINKKADKTDLYRIDTLSNTMDDIVKECNKTASDIQELKSTLYDNSTVSTKRVQDINVVVDTLHTASNSTKVALEKHEKVHHQLQQDLQKLLTKFSTLSENQAVFSKQINNTHEDHKQTNDHVNDLRVQTQTLKQQVSESILEVKNYVIGQLEDQNSQLNRKVEVGELNQLIESHVTNGIQEAELKTHQMMTTTKSQFHESYQTRLNEHEAHIASLQKSLETAIAIQSSEKRDADDHTVQIKAHIQNVSNQLDALRKQCNSYVPRDDLQLMMERKAEVEHVNRWITQHTSDINSILDMKTNVNDFVVLREKVGNKVDERALTELRQEIFEQTVVKAKIEGFINTVESTYLTRDQMHQLMNQHYDTLQGELRSSLQKNQADLASMEYDLSKNNQDAKNSLENQISLLREELKSYAKADSGYITFDSLKRLTENMQEEIKRVVHAAKLDIKQLDNEHASIYIRKHEFNVLIDQKVSNLRRSIEQLHRSIGQVMIAQAKPAIKPQSPTKPLRMSRTDF